MTQTQAVAVVEKPKDKIAAIDHALDERSEALLAILPSTMDYTRFRKVVTLAVSKNPDLMDCTPSSIVRAVIEAAELGLEPTGVLGRAYLVPYRENVAAKGRPPKYEKRAQLQIGYLGMVDMLLRSGRVRAAEARLVYEGDLFEVNFGTNPGVIHKPWFLTSDPSKILLVYAIVWYVDGSWDVEPMRKDEIDGIRARSRSANKGPWVTDYGEMAKKTVLRRLAKRGPLTIEAIAAIARDDEREYAPTVSAPRVDDAKDRIMSKLRPAAIAAPAQEPASAEGVTPPASSADAPTEAEAATEEPVEVVEGEVVAVESAAEQTVAPLTDAEVADALDEADTEPIVECGTVSPYAEGSFCELAPGHRGGHRVGRSAWPNPR